MSWSDLIDGKILAMLRDLSQDDSGNEEPQSDNDNDEDSVSPGGH